MSVKVSGVMGSDSICRCVRFVESTERSDCPLKFRFFPLTVYQKKQRISPEIPGRLR